jgi:quercetin dioxygenase-like cupin family protein
MVGSELVPRVDGSALALSWIPLDGASAAFPAGDDALLYVASGSGALTIGGESHPLAAGSAALVLAGEEAVLEGAVTLVRATVGPGADRHAALGPRETVVQADAAGSGGATGGRSYEVLFGPENGSTRATLFVGHVPPGRAPWHFHLYDEIVWIPEGPARLHLAEGVAELGPGSAFRLRPRQVHVVENASPEHELTVVGFFTPAGSPSAAYLADAP